jgi:hypothetical protein
MTSTMMRVRRVGLGVAVAAFSVGVLATSTTGSVLSGSAHTASVVNGSSHTASVAATPVHAKPAHRWGN